jgi:hypothetical protein
MNEINLTQTTDAKIWAQEWLKILKENPSIATDEGTMIGWFANSIMAGYDACYRKYKFALTEDPYEDMKKSYSQDCKFKV